MDCVVNYAVVVVHFDALFLVSQLMIYTCQESGVTCDISSIHGFAQDSFFVLLGEARTLRNYDMWMLCDVVRPSWSDSA